MQIQETNTVWGFGGQIRSKMLEMRQVVLEFTPSTQFYLSPKRSLTYLVDALLAGVPVSQNFRICYLDIYSVVSLVTLDI